MKGDDYCTRLTHENIMELCSLWMREGPGSKPLSYYEDQVPWVFDYSTLRDNPFGNLS